MSFSIASTLEKMNSRDKDFRYMATADLYAELQKESFKMDADSEKKITSAMLKLLEDNSNQVQELVVKCLGPLAKRVKEPQLQDIVDVLCSHLLNDKKGAEELRDIAGIGLRTVIEEIPSEPASIPNIICKRLTPRLISGISSNESKPEIVTYCLEALNDLLGKFGTQMMADHDKILKVVQPQLSSKRTTSRKRAIGCLGHLAVTIPDSLFADLINNLIKLIEDSSSNPEKLRTYIQAIGAISRSVGYRLGKFLPTIMPRIIKYCEDKKYETDDELRENCFQCFESLIYRCPKEITPFLQKIIQLCLQFIKYDPNYADDDGEAMDIEDNDDDEEDVDEEEDYSDDDDMSWKVRRSSAKCLSAVITTRPELLQEVYTTIAPVLISRFKEREENVKLDVFSTFIDILKQTSLVSRRNPELTSLSDPLRELVPKVVAMITKQLKERSLKTRSGAFLLLKEIVIVLRGALTNQMAALVPGIQFSLGDKNTNSNLKIEALSFLKLVLASHQPAVFHPYIKVLAPPVFKAVRDSYYRISAEALRVCCEMVHVLRAPGASFDYKPFVPELFNATLEKLKTQDIDQEVKESAITCMGLIIANFGNDIKGELPAVLKILLDRLTNEITRLTTVKSLETIALSTVHVDLSPILADAIRELASFLRKANRQLKQSSLSTLGVLVNNYGKEAAAAELFKSVLVELAPLISDADLHLTHLALSLCSSLVRANPSSVSTIADQILPKSVDLLRSSLLQGLALESLLNLFTELVKSGDKNLSFDNLLKQVLSVFLTQKEVSKQIISNVAKAVAALSANASPTQRDATVAKFIKDLTTQDESTKHLALHCLGEIGRRIDLSNHSALQPSILSAFDSNVEETRQAASFALGNVAIGNLAVYLPQILEQIKSNPKIKYLLLHSIREIIVRQSASSNGIQVLQARQKDILPILFEECENEQEGTRNVVAECLGKLSIISPKELIPQLASRISAASPHTRSTVVTALKFAIVEKSPAEVDQLLLPVMPNFLGLLQDQDLNVRRNTLLTLNYAAHNKPMLVREVLPTYLPLIYSESKVKPELIREVDLGPFKHKVDDGLEIRKAAFECMYTLLDTCLDRVNVSAFIATLVDGLKDHYDIKMLAHLMVIRLAHIAGAALLEGLDQLVEPLRATVATKPKEGAVKQEVERNDELIRSALRAVMAITRIPNVESNLKFDEFLRQTVKTGDVGEKFAAIKAEAEQHGEGLLDPMDLS